jgi:hypothetical protein
VSFKSKAFDRTTGLWSRQRFSHFQFSLPDKTGWVGAFKHQPLITRGQRVSSIFQFNFSTLFQRDQSF